METMRTIIRRVGDDETIEQAIERLDLTAPRVTNESIDAVIADRMFFTPTSTLTVCVLTLRNGFTVTGESACASPENFNKEIGERIAFEKARAKIWELEGYALRELLSEEGGIESDIEATARVCHEVNRIYCGSLGDNSQLPWNESPQWLRDSIRNGVTMLLDNPVAGPGASHASWLQEKEDSGWVYGEVKDIEAKTHPCMVPFADLPVEQQRKDFFFVAIVRAMFGGAV